MNETFVIEATGLTRRFGTTEAVRDLSFRVEAGSVYGLLGKNGSGKTTTIKLLLGLLWPDAGSSRVLGEDLEDIFVAVVDGQSGPAREAA